ncbi:ricin B lectin domain-containing protein [Mycena floridula]|nr:ricin B lectin domain-containing protein [Mycena floridula]
MNPVSAKLIALSLFMAAASAQEPILQAPVNTPTLIQTFITNPRFAPCLAATSNADGAAVVIQNCGTRNTSNIEWNVIKGGAVESPTGSPDPGPVTPITLFGSKCLDVPNGVNADGVKLQIWTCGTGNKNQLWQVNGDGSISWAGSNKCLDDTDGKLNDGNPVQLWTCAQNNVNQAWNAVPPST